jgi:hypothetical protein
MSVDLTIDGAVAKVVLNRPEKLNALSVEMRENLCDYFARLRFDDAVRVVIVTGAGGASARVPMSTGWPGSRMICAPTASACSAADTPLSAHCMRSRSR